MKTEYLKSGRRVQYTDIDRDVRFGLYKFEIDALIQAIETAFEHKHFGCAALLEDLRELQERFLVEEGDSMLRREVIDRWCALP
jgi:hypothetical protein